MILPSYHYIWAVLFLETYVSVLHTVSLSHIYIRWHMYICHPTYYIKSSTSCCFAISEGPDTSFCSWAIPNLILNPLSGKEGTVPQIIPSSQPLHRWRTGHTGGLRLRIHCLNFWIIPLPPPWLLSVLISLLKYRTEEWIWTVSTKQYEGHEMYSLVGHLIGCFGEKSMRLL